MRVHQVDVVPRFHDPAQAGEEPDDPCACGDDYQCLSDWAEESFRCGICATIACPERKVICLESDGSGLYMPQTLWTHAREGLDVLRGRLLPCRAHLGELVLDSLEVNGVTLLEHSLQAKINGIGVISLYEF